MSDSDAAEDAPVKRAPKQQLLLRLPMHVHERLVSLAALETVKRGRIVNVQQVILEIVQRDLDHSGKSNSEGGDHRG